MHQGLDGLLGQSVYMPAPDNCRYNMEYTGIPLRTLLNEAGLGAAGDLSDKWVYVEGADASSNGRSIPMEKALDDVLVAFKANGEALRKEHGYPVRLVVPGWEGNMWVKWLRRIEVLDAPVESREETSKDTDTLADGTSRKWTWVMDAKSVVTSPSPQAPITHGPGPLVVTGLAWSGRGRITRVDVSTDGGKSWTQARLAADAIIEAVLARGGSITGEHGIGLTRKSFLSLGIDPAQIRMVLGDHYFFSVGDQAVHAQHLAVGAHGLADRIAVQEHLVAGGQVYHLLGKWDLVKKTQHQALGL